ncbi:MAG TPA: DUF2142 domain-containing protein [Chthoniobacterales bacterium]|nr:DUF2142 domain-containing protein [Chthoniobacterales bacterium]
MIDILRLSSERFHFDRRIFFAVYVLVGLPYLVLTGPFRAPDERNHFFRSYEISELRFHPFRVSSGPVGDNLPAGLSRLSEALGDHSNHRLEASRLVEARNVTLQRERREFAEFSTAAYSPLAYAPSALSIAFGRVLGAGPLALVYFARAANLLAGSWLIACALSCAGYARLPALLVALFPMTVSQVATVSADAMSFGVAFLWIAFVLETAIAAPGEVTRNRKIALVLVALALSQLRPPYPVLAFLVLLVPVRKFGRMGPAFACAVIAAGLLPAAGWNSVAAKLYSKPDNGQRVEPREQLQWVANHPGPFWHRVKLDLKKHGIDYWQQLVGRLGWLNIKLPRWTYAGCAVALFVLTVSGSKKPPWPSPPQRAALGAIVLLGIVAIEFMLYLTFSGVSSPFIIGVQGRYFTALAFLAAFAFSSSWVDLSRWNPGITAACLTVIGATHCSAYLALARAAGKI